MSGSLEPKWLRSLAAPPVGGPVAKPRRPFWILERLNQVQDSQTADIAATGGALPIGASLSDLVGGVLNLVRARLGSRN